FFLFTFAASTGTYTLSLHDALPISDRSHLSIFGRRHLHLRQRRVLSLSPALGRRAAGAEAVAVPVGLPPADPGGLPGRRHGREPDRKSTRLNSSHVAISYAVFCLKK